MDEDEKKEIEKTSDDDTVKITEEIPAHLMERLPEIMEVAHKMGIIQDEQFSYRGPLPPQVIENLTDELKGKLIDDLISTKKRKDEINAKRL